MCDGPGQQPVRLIHKSLPSAAAVHRRVHSSHANLALHSPPRIGITHNRNMIRTRGMSAEDGRVARVLLQGVFPAVLIAAIAGFGIIELVSSAKPAEPSLSPADTARQVFVVLVAAGFASMAVIQVAKSLLGLRGLYQHRQLLIWFGGHKDPAYHELLKALNLLGHSLRGIFDLPIEQLSAQISAAADFALTDPDRYERFLSSLTGTGIAPPRPPAAPEVGPALVAPETAAPTVGPDSDQMTLHYYVRASIDRLQATIGYRWRNYVRSTAMWLSGLFGIAIVEASRVTGLERGLDILAALLVGGFFSWLARDITASIERLRG